MLHSRLVVEGGMLDLLRRLVPLSVLILLVACAAQPPSKGGSSPSGSAPDQQSASRVNRTLVMAGRSETPSLASRPLREFGLTSTTVGRLFNAGLTIRDGEGNYHPYLAEALPQLNTDSWKVSPDGRMETTYRLKEGLTWQDGSPLTADDFVFALEVYTNPDVGQSASQPIASMDKVVAANDQTIVISWKALTPEAGNLAAGNASVSNPQAFPPLPRHLLDAQLKQGNIDAFIALPFWSTEYVGLGPYKIDHWEPGSYFEGVAFDGHVLGKPKIERIRMKFIPDFNTSLANMLAGEAHITVDDSIRFQQATVLRREWATNNGGTVLIYPALWRYSHIQQRAEYAKPATLLDARVRKALMFAVDKQALSDALFESEGILTDTPIPPTSSAFKEVDRVATKYPYDLRRTEQLMAEAGYAKGGDGVWTSPSAGRFAFEFYTFQSPQNENEMHVMADTWRQGGYDVNENVLAANLSGDSEMRDNRSGIVAASSPPGEVALAEHTTALIPGPRNRWLGVNRGGWSNAEFDRVAEQFNMTLDRDQRATLLVQMAKIFTEDAAAISLYFNPTTTAFVSNLKGPKPAIPEGTMSWDIYDWEWTS